MKLHISPDLSLPLDFVTQTQAILAKRGVGKSYTASVQAEEMLAARQQIVVLDPTGGWWGLKSSADGKTPGYPIAVFGGEHADVPLEEHAGEVIAQAIVERRFSAIIDLSLLRKGAMQRFMSPFLETLYRLNREAVHVFVDEADAFAPQKPFGEEARTLGAMEDLVRRGRKRGIGTTLITQRPAVISKNVLTQCEVLCVLRLVHPRDIDTVMEWVNVHADPEQAQQMIESLPSLPVGDAWFWCPAWDLFKRIHVRERQTFDSSATPKAGEKVRQPRVLADVDIQQLGEQIKSTVEQAKANDPAHLKRRILELEKALAQRPKEKVEKTVEKIVEVPVLKNGQLDKTHKLADRLHAAVDKLTAETAELRKLIAPAAVPRPVPATPKTVVHAAAMRREPVAVKVTKARDPLPEGAVSIGKSGKRRLLIALAQNPDGLTKRKLSLLSGISLKGGTWRTYLGELRGGGYVADQPDGSIAITGEGLAALGSYEPLPTGQKLIDYWRNELGESGKRAIFDVLVEAWPNGLPKEEVSSRSGIAIEGGTWRTYLGELRGLELVQGKSELKASDELFEESQVPDA